jgi:cell division protein FtsA
MDTRIGYPNEHLAGDSDSETTSPLYATAVGLVMNSLENKDRSESAVMMEEMQKDGSSEGNASEENEAVAAEQPKERRRFFDKWAERFKEFLDNAE